MSGLYDAEVKNVKTSWDIGTFDTEWIDASVSSLRWRAIAYCGDGGDDTGEV
jgi:hypothetical protein